MCAFTALSSSIYPHFSFSFSPFPHSFLSLLLFSLVGVFVSGGACYVPPPLQFPVSGPTLFCEYPSIAFFFFFPFVFLSYH